MGQIINCPVCGKNYNSERSAHRHFPDFDCGATKPKQTGRPKGSKHAKERKAVHSVRVYPSQMEKIEQQWGSLQQWVNKHLETLGET